jgi:hypothetical protein
VYDCIALLLPSHTDISISTSLQPTVRQTPTYPLVCATRFGNFNKEHSRICGIRQRSQHRIHNIIHLGSKNAEDGLEAICPRSVQVGISLGHTRHRSLRAYSLLGPSVLELTSPRANIILVALSYHQNYQISVPIHTVVSLGR